MTTYAEDVSAEGQESEAQTLEEPQTLEERSESSGVKWTPPAAIPIPDAASRVANRANGREPSTSAISSVADFRSFWGNSQAFARSDPGDQPEFRVRERSIYTRPGSRFGLRSRRRDTFVRKQEWVGRVERVFGDSFLVSLTDRTRPNEEEVTELSLEEVSARDRELVRPGAIFYWIIGYRDAEDGQRRSESLLRFKRPIPMTPEEKDAALLRARELQASVGRPVTPTD